MVKYPLQKCCSITVLFHCGVLLVLASTDRWIPASPPPTSLPPPHCPSPQIQKVLIFSTGPKLVYISQI